MNINVMMPTFGKDYQTQPSVTAAARQKALALLQHQGGSKGEPFIMAGHPATLTLHRDGEEVGLVVCLAPDKFNHMTKGLPLESRGLLTSIGAAKGNYQVSTGHSSPIQAAISHLSLMA